MSDSWTRALGRLQVEQLLEAAGVRRYLLESADVWALSELEDLSRGAAAELPRFLAAAAQRATALATTLLLDSAAPATSS